MKRFCEECGKEVETKIINKKETYNVCGEAIETDAQVMVCAECGEELFMEEFDNATLLSAYNEYRRKHKLLFPEEIKKIRGQYGLSQRSFAKLLNWGDKTICRYENGSIQDKAHNSLLLFLRDPENMRTYLTENEISFNARQYEKLMKTVEKLEKNEGYHLNNKLFNLYFSHNPSEENGFKTFDYEKFYSMVLFFAHKNRELLKTKLMKLLNYSDMIFYKENGISISGSRYVHFPYGPVPEHFDFLMGTMSIDHIAHIEIVCDGGYERHQVIPDEKLTDCFLTDNEIKVMERIYKKFEHYGSSDISEYSHAEKGYIETKPGDIIPYSYAKDIEVGL